MGNEGICSRNVECGERVVKYLRSGSSQGVNEITLVAVSVLE